MKSRHYSVFVFVLGVIAVLAASPLSAQTRVGEAAVVKNEVLRVKGSATSRVNVGDGLLRDEIVRTGLDSAARLVMSDSTNLSLGANGSRDVDSTLDILSQRGQTIVNLQEGQASVCTVSFECIQLTSPGDTAVITLSGGK